MFVTLSAHSDIYGHEKELSPGRVPGEVVISSVHLGRVNLGRVMLMSHLNNIVAYVACRKSLLTCHS